jgi:hypothetical protein
MDYIVMACLVGFALMMLTISYDIACQWKKNMRQRNDKLPEAIRLDVDNVEIQCGLPVWHASSHETECSNENSLSFRVGVGKSDGEGVERTWADLNPAAFHTKEMGVGNRADTLEDKIDSHNFLKNLMHGMWLFIVSRNALTSTRQELPCVESWWSPSRSGRVRSTHSKK